MDLELKVEYKLDMKNVDDLLLLEIKTRVEGMFAISNDGSATKLTEKGSRELEIYKESLSKYNLINNKSSFILANYLIQKIDFILESLKE